MAWKFDAVYVFISEMLVNGTFNLLHEQLLDYDSFETRNGHPNYFPLVNQKFPVEYFELDEGRTAKERRFEATIEPYLALQH